MKYILAISGGIDSMALLDMVATDHAGVRTTNFSDANWSDDFVVATFDHGIRGEQSHRDAEFVAKCCRDYGVTCRIGCGKLAIDASEEAARQARYAFLFRLSNELGGAKLVTAHHQDDLLETAVMNLVRGTGWRGLAPMADERIVRPLLSYTKADLTCYMLERDLPWVEDQTNFSPRYFRNRLRMCLDNCPTKSKECLLRQINAQRVLRPQIEDGVNRYIAKHCQRHDGGWRMRRYDLIMLPDGVAIEVLRQLTDGQLTRPQLNQLLLFAKTAQSGKRMVWKGVQVRVSKLYVLKY